MAEPGPLEPPAGPPAGGQVARVSLDPDGTSRLAAAFASAADDALAQHLEGGGEQPPASAKVRKRESDPPQLVSGLMTSAEAAARARGELQPCDVTITERGVRRALAHRAVVEAMKEMGFIPERLFDQLGVPEDKAHRASGI